MVGALNRISNHFPVFSGVLVETRTIISSMSLVLCGL